MKQLALISLLLTVASMCTVAAAPVEEDRALEVISRYVVSHTGWNRGVFRIEKGSASQGILRYEVIYIPEEKLVFIGGGKSFAVDYDAGRRKVLREWHYQ
jgi:hypothetical protein